MVPVPNRVGSAPALVGRLRERTVVLLPGVPAELAGLLPDVVARLRQDGVLGAAPPYRLWRTAQRAELALVRRCEPVRTRFPELDWSWWLTGWGVDVRIAAPPGAAEAIAPAPAASSALETAAALLDEQLGDTTFARTLIGLDEVVLGLLRDRGATLALAESCTGGLLGGAITAVPGSSAAFLGGLVCYADAAKRDLAGIPAALLREHGAVSEAVACALATGCRDRLGSTHGLSVTGIAGPDGGTAAKPVGTTWIGLATPDGVHAGCYRFPADRERNRRLAVAAALDTLRRSLVGPPGASPWRAEDTWAITTAPGDDAGGS
jgi:nicotinamide-nucleotide amidase